MRGEEIKYNKIEMYLAGEMKTEELQSFEAELLKNSALRKEVELHKGIEQASIEQDIIDFRGSVRSIIEDESSKKGNTQRYSWNYISIAATVSIILLVGFGVTQFFFNNTSTEQLFTAYYVPYEDLISGRGDDTINESITTCMMYYSQQEYNKAIEHFENIDISDKPLLQLYAGISYLNTDVLDKAHDIFNLISLEESLFKNEAKWYNALTYLKENNPGKAKVILAEIVRTANTSNYAQKAQTLLDELD